MDNLIWAVIGISGPELYSIELITIPEKRSINTLYTCDSELDCLKWIMTRSIGKALFEFNVNKLLPNI